MSKNAGKTLPKMLALSGTVLTWLPVLLTVLTSAAGSIRRRAFLLDYLMPAELFPFALVGAVLLVWVALRRRRMFVTVSAAAMAAFFACVLTIPLVTGLASGATQPEGWPLALSILSLALYEAALIATGVGGILLTRDLFRKSSE